MDAEALRNLTATLLTQMADKDAQLLEKDEQLKRDREIKTKQLKIDQLTHEIFARAGLALPRSTLAQWVGAWGVRLAQLVEAMTAQLLTRTVLHADETPVPMLKPGWDAHIVRICGVTRRANTMNSRPWSTTLPTAAPVSLLAGSSATGLESSSAMTTRATRHCSSTG